jgi:hypothetical protein
LRTLAGKAVGFLAAAATSFRPAGGFLLGGACAALLVLAFAGAGLALSRASIKAGSSSLELNLHLPSRPSLSMRPVA